MELNLELAAKIYESLIGRCIAPEARPWVEGYMRRNPALAGLLDDLFKPTDLGPNLFEVARLLIGLEAEGTFHQAEPILDWLLRFDASTRQTRDTLHQMAQDLGDPIPEAWPLNTLYLHNAVDRLTTLDWHDPEEVLDSLGITSRALPELLAICQARLQRAKNPNLRTRLDLVTQRLSFWSNLHRSVEKLEQRAEAIARRLEGEQGLEAEQADLLETLRQIRENDAELEKQLLELFPDK